MPPAAATESASALPSDACAGSPEAVETVYSYAPAPHLAGAVVRGVYREIRTPGGEALDVPSSVPGNVYACLNIVTRGEVRAAGAGAAALPRAFLCGPSSEAFGNVARAPLASLSIVLQPWVLREWFGIEPKTLADTWCDARELQPRSAAEVRFLAASEQAALSPAHWTSAFDACTGMAAAASAAMLAGALEQSGSVAGAATACGMGPRQFHRLFLQAHGLAPRRWLVLRQSEHALVRLLQPPADRGGAVPAQARGLAGVAGEAGYADQAHMTRTLRRLAGDTPGGLRSAIALGVPGPWVAKVAADVRIVQDSLQPPA